MYMYVVSFLHSSKSVTGNDYSDVLHMKKQAKDNTVLKVQNAGFPEFMKKAHIKAFAGLINLGALLWLKQAKLKKIKTAAGNTRVTGRMCFSWRRNVI